MKFENGNVKVEYDMEGLKFKDLSVAGSRLTTLKSKSEMFRRMYDAGVEVSEISKLTNSHYSFVYGVVSSSREIRKVERESKADVIRTEYERGLSIGEISKKLNTNYSYVFSVVKKYRESV